MKNNEITVIEQRRWINRYVVDGEFTVGSSCDGEGVTGEKSSDIRAERERSEAMERESVREELVTEERERNLRNLAESEVRGSEDG